MSYNVNVRSEPILARTDDSERLKRTAEIVSIDVGKVRLDMGALLQRTIREGGFMRYYNSHSLCFVPNLNDRGRSGEQRIGSMVVYRAI